jgi:hypothetical protein
MGSSEHHELAREAMSAKLAQNEEVQRALEATDDLVFTHVLLDESGQPYPDSVTLPARVFCAIWTDLRRKWTRRQPHD